MALPREHRFAPRLWRALWGGFRKEMSRERLHGVQFLTSGLPKMYSTTKHFLWEGGQLRAMYKMAERMSRLDPKIKKDIYTHSRDPSIPLDKLSQSERVKLNPAEQMRALLSAEESIRRRHDKEGNPIDEKNLKNQDKLSVLLKNGFQKSSLISREEARHLRDMIDFRAEIIGTGGKLSNAMGKWGRTQKLADAEKGLRNGVLRLQQMMTNLGPTIEKLENEYVARWNYYKSPEDREQLLNSMGDALETGTLSKEKR